MNKKDIQNKEDKSIDLLKELGMDSKESLSVDAKNSLYLVLWVIILVILSCSYEQDFSNIILGSILLAYVGASTIFFYLIIRDRI